MPVSFQPFRAAWAALVYGALAALVVVVYVLVVGAARWLVAGSDDDAWPALLATGLAAALLPPARRRLRRGVDRLRLGGQDDPYAVLSRLGRRLDAAAAPDVVLPDLVDTIARALRLPYVAIELRVRDDWVPEAASGVPVDDVLTLPLTHHGASIGRLLVAFRREGEAFSLADRALLDDVARQAGVAAHLVGLAAELQAARERLVSAREEERRRLRHRLHDGVGPTLAAVAMGAEAAAAVAERDPTAADEALERLQAEVRGTIADVRAISRELRPPALDDLGLERALRERAAELAGVGGTRTYDVVVEGSLDELPAALEVAAYRVASAALTAAATVAGGRVRVTLTSGGELAVRAVLDPAPGREALRHAVDAVGSACDDVGGTATVDDGGSLVIDARLPRSAVLVAPGSTS